MGWGRILFLLIAVLVHSENKLVAGFGHMMSYVIPNHETQMNQWYLSGNQSHDNMTYPRFFWHF